MSLNQRAAGRLSCICYDLAHKRFNRPTGRSAVRLVKTHTAVGARIPKLRRPASVQRPASKLHDAVILEIRAATRAEQPVTYKQPSDKKQHRAGDYRNSVPLRGRQIRYQERDSHAPCHDYGQHDSLKECVGSLELLANGGYPNSSNRGLSRSHGKPSPPVETSERKHRDSDACCHHSFGDIRKEERSDESCNQARNDNERDPNEFGVTSDPLARFLFHSC
jgi:hypothetical protein